MIGAMPAVALRHERKKGCQKNAMHVVDLSNRQLYQRPSHLQLQLGPSDKDLEDTGSPLNVLTPGHKKHNKQHKDVVSWIITRRGREYYFFGRIPVLYFTVLLLLMGIIVLIVGLVQLKPGADAAVNRFYIISAGGFLLFVGLVLAIARCCCCLMRGKRRKSTSRPKGESPGTHSAHMVKTGTDEAMSAHQVETPHKKQTPKTPQKPHLENTVTLIHVGESNGHVETAASKPCAASAPAPDVTEGVVSPSTVDTKAPGEGS